MTMTTQIGPSLRPSASLRCCRAQRYGQDMTSPGRNSWLIIVAFATPQPIERLIE